MGRSWRANQVLHLIHSDLCGSISPASNGKKGYFISFIDDYNRKIWVYFLMARNKAFEVFKIFKASIENEGRKSIKILRTH